MLRLSPARIFSGEALNIGNSKTIDVPMDGHAWFALMAEIAITLVVGTGTGAISEGELNIIKNILTETDLDKDCHNAPGRALFRYAHFAKGVEPVKDAMAAASATYRVNVPLMFGDPLARKGWETMLNTSRYDSFSIRVNLGTVADLLSSPGTASITATLSLTALRSNEKAGRGYVPRGYPFFKGLAPINHTDLRQNFSRVADERIRRILYMTATGATAGVPFSGTPADAGLTDISVDHGNQYEPKLITRLQLEADNKEAYRLASRPTGFHMLDYMPEGTLDESIVMHPDLRPKLEMSWATDTGTGTTVNTLIDGARAIK